MPRPARDRLALEMARLDRAYAGVVHPWLASIGRWRRTFQGRRVIVVGLLSSPSGLGRAARLLIKDLQARDIEVLPVDLTRRLGHPVETCFPGALEPAVAARRGASDLIVQLNPPHFAMALRLFPLTLLRRASVIGYWAWELGVAPPAWRLDARYCDEIWVPSDFVADSLRAGGVGGGIPIDVVPHHVDRDPMPPRDPRRGREMRARLGIAPDAFVAGTTWSMRSSFARKGALSAIRAFWRGFPRLDPNCALLLRCPDGEVYPAGMLEVREAAEADPRIVVLDGSPPCGQIADFYNAIDVYLSLTRGEGYGLTIAEAAQAGLPVLATAWGLAADLGARANVIPISYSLVPLVDPQRVYAAEPGAVWAEPDLSDAGRHLRALAGAARADAARADAARADAARADAARADAARRARLPADGPALGQAALP
jgi:glycosyltransferase involved in cell wall biosynthesis